ncbi:hypothetical protein [Achromobacter sp. AGC39]
MSLEDRQKMLHALVQRRHPDYAKLMPHWTFLSSAYEGGRDWFVPNIHRYLKEGDTEYAARVRRAYRFNHTREVVDLLSKYLFKMEISRNEANAPDSLKKFWKKATLNGLSIRDFMKGVADDTSQLGRVWIVVDNNASGSVLTKAEEGNVQTYAYTVLPGNMMDASFDECGELNWILFYEESRDDEDPLTSSGARVERYRLWTREDWTLYRIDRSNAGTKLMVSATADGKGLVAVTDAIKQGVTGELGTMHVAKDESKFTVIEEDYGVHDLGVVPVVPASHLISKGLYSAPGLIDDIAYLDRAVANYLSNLDAIIQDQTFSQLVIPAQAVEPDKDGIDDKLVEMGTKRIFTYDAEGGAAPAYISPDVKQAQLILAVIAKIINEIYHTAGMAGERTKEDNSQGIDNSSGVAKAYDFERVNSMLAAKADSLEWVEYRIAELVCKWNGVDVPDLEEPRLVSYPDNFDVRGLHDEFDIAARLSVVNAPDAVRRQQMEQLIDKLFPQLDVKLIAAMKKELQNWPPEPPAPAAGSENTPEKAVKAAANNSLGNQLVKPAGK